LFGVAEKIPFCSKNIDQSDITSMALFGFIKYRFLTKIFDFDKTNMTWFLIEQIGPCFFLQFLYAPIFFVHNSKIRRTKFDVRKNWYKKQKNGVKSYFSVKIQKIFVQNLV